ncbi:glycosyltransferase family 1 protein [Candidatus Saccharibacteria bacterium]|nr:MAG: glycosyltransferase family 1 protein [Candidatus Saccharibacteria bacterium]
MRITWLSWKDINHPEAGGAERVSDEIRIRLAESGHEVTLITARYIDAKPEENVRGVRVLRAGNRYSVYSKARGLFRSLPEQDLVIDEMNTVPFFASFYRSKAPTILLTYQLARQVWFYQMAFPFSYIGYWLEPIYLRLLSRRYKHVLTESESTKKDLAKYGYAKSSVSVFRVGMDTPRPASLPTHRIGYTVIFLGAFRPMKRPLDAIIAFEKARDLQPKLTLVMAGSTNGTYAQKVLEYVKSSRHSEAIDIKGRVSEEQKISLLKKADLILVTSIKEGWGLIVTEANSQGTPGVVYDTDGLRDSVVADKTGLVVPSGDTSAMASAITRILTNTKSYQELRQTAFTHSAQFTYTQSYKDFTSILAKAGLLK